jgi:hypothetical protein
MIFVQQVYRVAMAIYYFWFSLAYLFPFSLEDIFGGRFCPWFSAIGTFSIFGGVYWSSALAFARSQFHQQTFMSSFCMCRSQKHKKTVKLSVFLCFRDLRAQKLLIRTLMKTTPGLNFTTTILKTALSYSV